MERSNNPENEGSISNPLVDENIIVERYEPEELIDESDTATILDEVELLSRESVKAYLLDIGRTQLLKPDEEVRPARRIAHCDMIAKRNLVQANRQDLERMLNKLKPIERQVLRLRFGLDDGHQRTLNEVGQLVGLTPERVRQIEFNALGKLRQTKRSSRLRLASGS